SLSRLLDHPAPALLAAPARLSRVLQRCGGETRGELAGLGAPHSVGDGEERRLRDEGVLVVPAPPPGVGQCRRLSEAQGHASYLNSVSPTRTTSPALSRFGRVRRVPLR